MFLCFLCQEGLGQRTVGGIQLDWMWRGKHKACPHGVKKARWNVECLRALQRKAEGLETPGVIINTQQAWVVGKELTHTPPLCIRSPVLPWLRSAQIWLLLDFKAVHLISFPKFYWLYFRKNRKKKIYVFLFQEKIVKMCKAHRLKWIKSGGKWKGKGGEILHKNFAMPSHPQSEVPGLRSQRENPQYSSWDLDCHLRKSPLISRGPRPCWIVVFLSLIEFLWRFIKWGTETGDTQEYRLAASIFRMLYSLPTLCKARLQMTSLGPQQSPRSWWVFGSPSQQW